MLRNLIYNIEGDDLHGDEEYGIQVDVTVEDVAAFVREYGKRKRPALFDEEKIVEGGVAFLGVLLDDLDFFDMVLDGLFDDDGEFEEFLKDRHQDEFYDYLNER